MARDRASGCPDRWGLQFVSRFGSPQRPVACPCLWSNKLVLEHMASMLWRDTELGLSLSVLIGLMWDSKESP